MYRLLDDPHPPRATPDHLARVRRRAVRIRRRKAALGAAAAAIVVAGCFTAVLATSSGARPVRVQVTPAASARPTAPVPAATPTGQAYQLLDAVIVPPGAKQVSSLHPSASGEAASGAFEQGSVFSEPLLDCTPEVDVSRFWVVAENFAAAFSYLDSHAPTWITYGFGETSDKDGLIAYSLNGTPTGPGWSRLAHYPPAGAAAAIVIAIAPTANGETGIRVDAQAAPPSAKCPILLPPNETGH